MDTAPDQRPADQTPSPTDGAARTVAPGSWLVLLACLLVGFVVAYLAKAVLIPVTGAVLLSLTLSPAARWLDRHGIPRRVGALLIAIVVTGLMVVLVMLITNLISQWIDKAPELADTLQERMEVFSEPMASLDNASRALTEEKEKEQATTLVNYPYDGVGVNESIDAEQTPDQPATSTLQPNKLSALDLLIFVAGESIAILAGGFICIVLTFFLLLSGDVFLAKLLSLSPTLSDKKKAMAVVREIEKNLSQFIGVWTLINITVGLVVWASFEAVGVPRAWLWGLAAILCNYIPYAGPWALGAIALLMGLMTFENPWLMLLPALIILFVNALEGFIVSPMVHGQRLNLNTVAVFLSVVVGGWLWGIPGALMAVPILVVAYVICAAMPALHALALFLDDSAPGLNRYGGRDKGDAGSDRTPPLSNKGGEASARSAD